MSNLESYFPPSNNIQVIDDTGRERDIPVEDYWLNDADALPGWITPQEHAAHNGLEHIITDIHEKIGGNDE